MPTCDYCDQSIEPGSSKCPHCSAPRDPSGDVMPSSQGEGRSNTTAGGTQAGSAAGSSAQQGAGQAGGSSQEASSEGGLSNIVQSLQSGDVGGVSKGLQEMASSGQLDVNKLATDLGVNTKGLDLGDIAKNLTSGGSQSSNVASALSKQGGGIGDLLKSAAGALKSPSGLAVGGAALAAGAVGAGYLLHKSRGGGSISDTIGSITGGAGDAVEGIGDKLSSLIGGSSGPTEQDMAQFNHIAEQLPIATYDQLKEGQAVLAQWDRDQWRPGKIGWVDGGQARVTFDSGLERWCEPRDLRLPPQPGQPVRMPPTSSAGQESVSSPTGLPAIGATVQGQVNPEQWQPGQVVDTDTIGERIRVRFENGFETWLEMDQFRQG